MPTSPPLPETVTAAEANRQFSKLLRGVREGRSYVVTSHGEPVARLEPAPSQGKVSAEVIASRRAHLEELSKRPVLNLGRFDRDALNEEMLAERGKR
jgi:prevent-host-death family protein